MIGYYVELHQILCAPILLNLPYYIFFILLGSKSRSNIFILSVIHLSIKILITFLKKSVFWFHAWSVCLCLQYLSTFYSRLILLYSYHLGLVSNFSHCTLVLPLSSGAHTLSILLFHGPGFLSYIFVILFPCLQYARFQYFTLVLLLYQF